MAAQRIVVTSPWKLGLFVFLLVAACGFGLIYAYLEYFGGTLDFSDQKSLTVFYGVCGGVAFLGLLGYLSVVSAAQPMDRVVHGGKRRKKLLKSASGVSDPMAIDLEDYQDEPDLVKILDHWRNDHETAVNAIDNSTAQTEAVTSFAKRVRDARESGVAIDSDDIQGGMVAAAESVNSLLEELRGLRGVSVSGKSELNSLRDALMRGVPALRQRHAGIEEVAGSIEQSASSLDDAAEPSSPKRDGGQVPSVEDLLLDSNLKDTCQRNHQRIAELRMSLDSLADEANRLAINSALQVSRLGEAGAPLMETMDKLGAISSRFQKLVADLRICENDQQMTESQINGLLGRVQREWARMSGAPVESGGDGADMQSLQSSLREGAGQLRRLSRELAEEIAVLEGASSGQPAQEIPAAGDQPQAAPKAAAPGLTQEDQLAQIHDELFQKAPPAQDAPAAADQPQDEVHDLADFGAVPLENETTGAEDEEQIYDLSDFGAVEI